jgi:predicted transcriptional regulator
MASFRFSDTFNSLLGELCEKLSRTKTTVIVDAVTAYASGVLPDRELNTRLDSLAGEIAALRQGQGEIRTLCLQILKNQQGDTDSVP